MQRWVLKASLLETLSKINQFTIPERVRDEVLKGKEKLDSLLLERLISENKSQVQKVNPKLKTKLKQLLGLTKGELEVVTLALPQKHPVLTDDKKCIHAAKSLALPLMTSLHIVKELHKKKYIDHKKAMLAFDILEEQGRYKKSIIKSYRGELDDEKRLS